MLSLLWSRVPNYLEIVIGTLPQSILEVWFDEYTEKFNNDAISKGIFRDITGVPATITHAFINTEVSKTGIKNDWISSAGNLLQTTCKLSLLAPVLNNVTSTSDDVGQASEFSYYICSPIASTLNVISKERQLEKKIDIFPLKYMYANVKPDWFIKSILGSLVSSAFASSAAKFLTNIGFSIFIKNSTYYIENKLLVDMFNSNINDDVWTKIDKLHNATDSNDLCSGDAILLGSSFISKLVVNIINSYVIATSARFGLACFNTLLKEQPLLVLFTAAIIVEQKVSDYISNLYDFEVVSEDMQNVFPITTYDTVEEVIPEVIREYDCCGNNLSFNADEYSIVSYPGFLGYKSLYDNYKTIELGCINAYCDTDS